MNPSRPPDFVIGPPGDPYMRRWHLIPRNGEFNVYLHHILHDDDDRAMHDHPWPSCSFMLAGVIDEVTPNGTNQFVAGDVIFREAEYTHRLVVVEPAWTLFVTGAKVREWGFHCPEKWVHWTKFVDENGGQIGKGCDGAFLQAAGRHLH